MVEWWCRRNKSKNHFDSSVKRKDDQYFRIACKSILGMKTKNKSFINTSRDERQTQAAEIIRKEDAEDTVKNIT